MSRMPTYDKIHNQFKLNGLNFNKKELSTASYCFIKEGKIYERVIGDFLLDWLDNRDYIEVQTSGATGVPKTIQLKKQYLVHSAIATGDFFGLRIGSSVLHCLPGRYIAGKMMLVRAMILGLQIDLVKPTINPLEDVEKKYDFSAMVPIQLSNSLNKINLIDKLIVGGAPFEDTLKEKTQNLSTTVYETYGMTETVTHVAVKRINHFDKEEDRKASLFNALPKVKFYTDKRNCLVIDAPMISEKEIVTNDIVLLKNEHQFEWKGRYDNVINSGGVKLIPEEIEKKLSSVIFERFFVYGENDEELGQRLVLIVEGSEQEELMSVIKQQVSLEKYELPKVIYFVDQFTETKTGKIIRHATANSIFEVIEVK